MEVPMSEDEGVLMEWAPYTNLIHQIPLKVQSGLFAQDLNLTCIDVTNEYLALGTNIGLVFWYGRQKGDIQRLRCENSNCPLTFVKIVSTVDFMVAAGNKNGQVTIFQIPKPHPESLPESLKPKITRQVERYTVGDLHRSEITCIEWSKNGMRLFSGDKSGLVVMTEVDFYMHLCKSLEIINETYEIVQISYYQNYLLVSSVYRSIICHKLDSKWDVNQVGKRDRKSLCKLGGIFHYNYEKPNDFNIYCARPGLRVWTSDRQGNVLQTLLFKDAIAHPIGNVELLNPAQRKKPKSTKDTNFGPLLIFKEKYLISYNEDQLYIINPANLVAIATIDNVRRILSVAVNKGEIFILEGERSLIRISSEPDCQLNKTDDNLMTKSLTNPLKAAVNTIKELTGADSHINFSDVSDQCDHFLNTLKETTIATFNTEPSNVIKAEECFELPVVKELPSDINTNILDKFVNNFIGGTDGLFEDSMEANMKQISHENKMNEFTSQQNEMCELIEDKIKETDIVCRSKKSKRNIIDLNDDIVKKEEPKKRDRSVESKGKESRQQFVQGANKRFPHNMSPESIEKEIRDKEEILAKMLDLEPITIAEVKPPSPEILYLNESIQKFTLSSVNTTKKTDEPKNIPTPVKHQSVKSQVINTAKISPRLFIEPPPKCVSIPNVWNLKEIKIESDKSNNTQVNPRISSDNNEELDDWELV